MLKLSLFALVDQTAVLAQQEGVPLLSPKAVISLEYPNYWQLNQLIALSQDGRYLIDASAVARNIRVWDWKKEEVVQRLLLNEEVPEQNDNKSRVVGSLEHLGGGQNMVFTPDGRRVGACVRSIAKAPGTYAIVRLWNLDTGTVAADLIGGVLRNVAGLDQESVLLTSCQAISYSPDGKYVAVLVKGTLFANYDDYKAAKADYKNAAAKRKVGTSGIILYETENWQLVRFIYPEKVMQRVNSRVLFTGKDAEALALVSERPTPIPNNPDANPKSLSNQIVRWNLKNGEVLEQKDAPELTSRIYVGVWWSWLPGGREVWWPSVFENEYYQTKDEAQQCEQADTPASFVSETVQDCAYSWAISMMDMNSGKMKFLAPFKKNPPLHVQVQQKLKLFLAAISPDGIYLVVLRSMSNPKKGLNDESTLEIFNRETFQLEGRYSWSGVFSSAPQFSADSKYFTFKSGELGYPNRFATIFELPKGK